MRYCDKCGAKIHDNFSLCPICRNMSDTDRKKYILSSTIIYLFVFIMSAFHAVFYIYNSPKELIRLNDLGSDYKPPTDFINLARNELPLNYITVVIMYCILPAAFLIFTILINMKKPYRLLIIFPVAGIAAEAAQLAQQFHNYAAAVKRNLSYLYCIIGMDILSALLITAFFIFMIRMILHGYSISQSRWLIVVGFFFVFSRLIIKLTLYDDDELMPYFRELKGYLLFSATLLNVKKRYITSKSL